MTTTTASYNNIIQLDFNPATGAYTMNTNFGGLLSDSNIIGDDPLDSNPADGSAGDGTESSGESLFWTGAPPSPGTVVNYTGYMTGGEPIVEFGPTYMLLTNSMDDIADGTATAGTYTYCFAAGTAIATPEGERPVEALAIGDVVLTAEGKTAPVKWIGRQTINPLFARLNGELPVRIRAGALGDSLPIRDLYVSPDHAMLVDGVLVHALALVNGASITQMADWPHENVEYFHIELENHDLVLAEGAPAETFVDNGSRTRFDNYAEYVALYGEESAIPELDFPRVKYQRQLSAFTKKRLLAIALEHIATAA